MAAPYLITGAECYNEVHPRLDICVLQESHPKQFTLFILAWKEIRKPEYQPAAAQFSQIGGIHGMPYTRWMGDPDQAPQSDRGIWLGYCNHASIMFPNWHRPYLMLLEQAISEVAHGIAGKFANSHPAEGKLWIEAARALRLPYWDWTHQRTNQEGMPPVLVDSKLELEMPGGGRERHNNILAYYEFHRPIDGFNNRLEYKIIYDAKDDKKVPDTMAYFKEWKRTYRCPNSSPVDVADDYQQVNKVLTAGKPTPDAPFPIGSWANLSSTVSAMFKFPINISKPLYANAWDEFSNTRFQSGHQDPEDRKKINSWTWNCPSIEQPHNYVHLVVGGIGHMGDNDTAGFDPVFFLHHCNVDRLLSFWEQVYPDYVAGTEGYLSYDGKGRIPFTQTRGTYIERPSEEVNENTPLMPFRKSDYTYWDSRDTHSLKFKSKDLELPNKYYTYPAIAGVELNILEQKLDEKTRDEQRIKLREHFEVYSTQGGHEYLAVVSLSEDYFPGSYMLTLAIEIDGSQYEIGSVAVLGRGKSSSCGNCRGRREAGVRVRGVIPIPSTAIDDIIQSKLPIGARSAPESLDERAIAVLKDNFRAYLTLPSGNLLGWPTEKPIQRAEQIVLSQVQNSPLPEAAAPAIRFLSRQLTEEQGEPRVGEPISAHWRSAPGSKFGYTDHGWLNLGPWVEAVHK
ncbi:hypothetical protein RSOLAG1IB_10331 [Rhizoctonia solani AG-1 IB]|uniref:tyrosinase n=1 Tax=Thanatephorus cucumeris (strain AG1-IB / isolate 7/3/14) TaxID=1108050 RepID=M5C5W9_THACB|nr:hypothetical protein BN14_08909 [Rhizoctonia solani AG-1 IB]CEL62267.1 hypothetical protein RSOLAG1IB_10331 [Rhizoctonia solani AG-1 IB]